MAANKKAGTKDSDQETTLWEQLAGEKDLDRLVDRLTQSVFQSCSSEASSRAHRPEFILLLHGEMGAGKTSLVSRCLSRLGLPDTMPVTSPTYTYLNDYLVEGRWFAHLDCYRMEAGQDLNELLGLQNYHGFFIEWPERLRSLDLDARAKYRLSIQYVEGDRALRRYLLSSLT